MIVLRFSMQGEDTIEHTSGKCHVFTFWSTCRPLCNICIHLITLLNILCVKILKAPLNAMCQKGDTKLSTINVTYHTPPNRVSDTTMHVTLNTMHGAVFWISYN